MHAFVLMSNHYHLCVETPDANLGVGLQWLQSTFFTNRFSRFVHERGHVFQGRYKALLIERGNSLLRVVNYIHLNPVRAGIEKVETLERYTMSSFPKFFNRKRPACLVNADWLSLAGNLKPTMAGMRCYQKGEDRAILLLEEGLRLLGKGLGDLGSDLMLAPWKVVLAGWIKQQSSVGNRWFSEVMHMGSIYGISKAIAEETRTMGQRNLWRKLRTANSKA